MIVHGITPIEHRAAATPSESRRPDAGSCGLAISRARIGRRARYLSVSGIVSVVRSTQSAIPPTR
jgi:hypothetical protein